jgi:hypothetical protein
MATYLMLGQWTDQGIMPARRSVPSVANHFGENPLHLVGRERTVIVRRFDESS